MVKDLDQKLPSWCLLRPLVMSEPNVSGAQQGFQMLKKRWFNKIAFQWFDWVKPTLWLRGGIITLHRYVVQYLYLCNSVTLNGINLSWAVGHGQPDMFLKAHSNKCHRDRDHLEPWSSDHWESSVKNIGQWKEIISHHDGHRGKYKS